MQTQECLERADVADGNKWNVEALYSNLKAWKDDLETSGDLKKKPHWPKLQKYRGRLGESASTLRNFFEETFAIDRHLSKLYTYAHLRGDEDLANDEYKTALIQISTLYHDFSAELAWAEPEILSLPEEVLAGYLESPELEDFRLHLERIVRLKPHTLSSKEEELLARAGKVFGAPHKAFGAFNNADLKFAPAKDKEGNELEMTHAKYLVYLRSQDRVLRKSAFESCHQAFDAYENTLTELYNGTVQKHVFSTKVRGFSSSIESALFPNQIDTSVYSNLIGSARKHIGVLHKYMALRKKLLGVDELHPYDLYVPIVEDVDLKFPYEEAVNLVIDSVASLGAEYQGILRKGLIEDRWVDRYENLRKCSGAYSSGCYDGMPYILMNYQGEFNSLKTLAHEAGHSMHSYYSHANQPYQYSHYPIFLAEVASTFNEELMIQHLLQRDLTKREKAYILNQKIEDIRATFFRQTMFAEFELVIHTLAEQDVPLTPTLLKEKYRELNADYFGSDVVLDSLLDSEWARIPHFYRNFYVYQYATGIAAALALFNHVEKGGEIAREQYLTFLSAGCSQYPLDILEQAGVNMRVEEPIIALIGYFDHLVDELEKNLQ